MADHASDVLALLDALGLERVVLGGHSFGAYLAIYIAAKFPARVEKLIVIERFKRPTVGRLEIEYTINDPTYYTRPWTAKVNARYTTGTELFEFVCNENERSTAHMGPNIK